MVWFYIPCNSPGRAAPGDIYTLQVETDDAKAWADSVGITFVETSAQERDGMQVALAPGEPSGNVTLAFETIIHEIFHTVAKGPARGSEPVVKLKKESKNGGSQGGGCSC